MKAPKMTSETHVINDLYASLDDTPDAIGVWERILEIWVSQGSQEMIHGTALELLRLDPSNQTALSHIPHSIPQRPATLQPSSPQPLHPPTPTSSNPLPEIGTTIASMEKGYKALKGDASLIYEELKYVKRTVPSSPSPGSPSDTRNPQATDTEILENLANLSIGRVNVVIPMSQPLSIRESARKIVASSTRAAELIAEDFDSILQWCKRQTPPLAPDAIRTRLIKRKTLLDAALPESLSPITATAFANTERENLNRKYENNETMLGDAINEIPAENFFVSEDNYAWDMEELASAISANGGVMRNPLSRQMFSDADILHILDHPKGRRLRAQHEAQHRMKRGFRTKTIEWVEKLGTIMLGDQSSDAAPSRQVMDEFLAYMITLPKTEQEVINGLKIPGKDRNTGQEFDYTVGESVRDAKANTTCFHKVGDFLSQAAVYLRK